MFLPLSRRGGGKFAPGFIVSGSFISLSFGHCSSFFLSLCFFPCIIFPLCHLSPLSVSCNTTDGICERWGRSQRISIYLTLVCPSSSSHSLIYHTQVLFIVVWHRALGPWLYTSLSAPLIITASLGNKPTYLHFLWTTFMLTLVKMLKLSVLILGCYHWLKVIL